MNDLVFKGANDLVLTNSLLVAEKFGKEHRHVLDAIRDLIKGCAENSAVPMFEETTYINPQNKQEYPMFIMNRDGFTLLAMGFTGKKALNFKMDFINAFNKMETMLRSDDYILMRSQQILQKRVEMAEQKVRALEEKNALQDAQLRQAAPKVKYVDEVLQSVNTYTSTQIAKEIGMDAAKFHKALKEIFLKIFRFFFGNMKIMRNFATLQDGSRICSVGQPVKLLKVDLGIFYAPYFNI